MATLARMVYGAMAAAAITMVLGCDMSPSATPPSNTDPGTNPGYSRPEQPGTDNTGGPEVMLKSLGKGGSGVGAASAAVPENSYVATTNPSSAEEAEKTKADHASQPTQGAAEKPKGDSTSEPAKGAAEQPKSDPASETPKGTGEKDLGEQPAK